MYFCSKAATIGLKDMLAVKPSPDEFSPAKCKLPSCLVWDLEETLAQPLENHSLVMTAAEQMMVCCTAYRLTTFCMNNQSIWQHLAHPSHLLQLIGTKRKGFAHTVHIPLSFCASRHAHPGIVVVLPRFHSKLPVGILPSPAAVDSGYGRRFPVWDECMVSE